MNSINILNLNTMPRNFNDYFYIGRGKTSILGNPFSIKEYGREGAIAQYREWLWRKNIKPWLQTGYPNEVVSEIDALSQVNKQQSLNLACFCAPERCHGEIIRNTIIWMQRPWIVVSGSRSIQNLPYDAIFHLEKGIRMGANFLVGDASGIDTLVQWFLSKKEYRHVMIFHIGNAPRNCLFPTQIKVNANSYTGRDEIMCGFAEFGLAIWDGKSRGTARNIQQVKKTVVVNISDNTNISCK